jgi:hypothetical protein
MAWVAVGLFLGCCAGMVGFLGWFAWTVYRHW